MHSECLFLLSKKSDFFFVKEGRFKKKLQDENHQKKSSPNLWIFLTICGEIQVQFVISTFKTEITKWCQI